MPTMQKSKPSPPRKPVKMATFVAPVAMGLSAELPTSAPSSAWEALARTVLPTVIPTSLAVMESRVSITIPLVGMGPSARSAMDFWLLPRPRRISPPV